MMRRSKSYGSRQSAGNCGLRVFPPMGGGRREIRPFEWIDFEVTQRELKFQDYAVIRNKVVPREQNALGFDEGYDHCSFPVAGLLETFPPEQLDRGASKKEPAQRGDFQRVAAAIKKLFSDKIPEVQTNSDVARAVAKHMQESKAKVPHQRTLLAHIRKIRGK